jgi:hypothetical protein
MLKSFAFGLAGVAMLPLAVRPAGKGILPTSESNDAKYTLTQERVRFKLAVL